MSALSFEERVREREAVLRAAQEKRVSDIPLEVRLRLAIVPVWTLALAPAAELRNSEVATVFERLCDEGLMRREVASLGMRHRREATARYWIPRATRAALLEEAGRGKWLRHEMQLVAERILQLVHQGTPAPPMTERWAQLAAASDSAHYLDKRVRTFLGERDSGAALRWVEAALVLEPLVGGELTVAVARAGRLIELFHRHEHDARALQHFLERPEQVQAFEQLLAGDDELWALHYVGAGGVGKTMMMRYITAKLIPDLRGTSARLDFDYLNPDYPGRAPALLLAALAEELALHDDSGTSERLFMRFSRRRSALDERVRDLPVGAADAALDSPEFAHVLSSFADAVERLPRPVVLLLDTCEELAKIRPDGTVPANVQATFTILERLHERLPWLRVVFGGRRALAKRGAGWTAVGARQDERPYLCVQPVRGFKAEEARRFLVERMRTPETLVDPILRRSEDDRGADRFEFDAPERAEATQKRYSPFELRLYADWVAEDATISAAEILAADSHRYVEMRIAGRIENPEVRALMPAVALLGRFDRDTLRVLTDIDDEGFEAVLEEIAAQDWLERQANGFLQVDQGLLPKLLAYYRTRHPADVERVRAIAVEYLQRVTLERPLRSLDLSHFEVCLRLLGSDLPAATAWWRAVEERFAREEAYPWARGMLYRIAEAGDSDPVTAPGQIALAIPEPLMGSVLATYAATQMHASPGADLSASWASVARAADAHPLPDERMRLAGRAAAGYITAAARAGQAQSSVALQMLQDVIAAGSLTSQMGASLIAAAEAIVERAEMLPAPEAGAVEVARAVASAIAASPEVALELRGFALALEARTWLLLGNALDLGRFDVAVELASVAEPLRQTWLDWRAPDDLASRVTLERLRAAVRRQAVPDSLLRIEQVLVQAGPLTIDRERLASAIVSVLRNRRPLTRAELTVVQQVVRSFGAESGELVCDAHREFRPLQTVLAEELASQGEVAEALALLGGGVSANEQASASYRAVHGAELVMARVVLRMRLQEVGRRVAPAPDDLESTEIAWLLDGLDGRRATALCEPAAIEVSLGGRHEPEWLHARWRALYGLAPEWAKAAVEWIRSVGVPDPVPASTATPAQAARWLDLLEANALARQFGMEPPFGGVDQLLRRLGAPLASARSLDGARADVADCEARWRIALRERALAPRSFDVNTEALSDAIGARRMAEIEFQEAQALALRLPREARDLFADAGERFAACGDHNGSLLCAIGLALVCVRAADGTGLASALGAARASLERASLPLPGWGRIEQLAASGEHAELERAAPPEWTPWLIRLIVCVAWAAPRPPTAAQQLLQSHYNPGGGPSLLPAGLDGLLDPAPSRRRLISRRRGRRPLVTQLVYWLLVIGLIVGAGEVPQDTAGTTWIGFGLIILIAIGLYWSGRDLWSRLNAQRRRVVSITAAPGSATQAVEPVLQVGVTLARRGGQILAKPGAASVAVAGAYVDAAAELPEAFVSALAPVVKRVRKRTAPLDLRVDRRAAPVCWEALLAHSVASIQRPREIPFRCRRVNDAVPLAAATTWRNLRAVSIFAGPHRELARAWSVRGLFLETGERWADVRAGSIAQPHVVHIVADAVETAAGVRLELVDAGAASTEPSDIGRGDLLRADELPLLFTQAGLYVLQGRPLSASARTRAEREQAALLRAFAGELADLGIPAVVTVPPLAEPAAVAVTRRLAGCLRGSRPHELVFLRGRRTIRNWSASSAFAHAIADINRKVLKSSDDLEAAFDICLYMNTWRASVQATAGAQTPAPSSVPLAVEGASAPVAGAASSAERSVT